LLFFNPEQYRDSRSDAATKKSSTDSLSTKLIFVRFIDIESVHDFLVATSDHEALYWSGLKNKKKKMANLHLGEMI